MLKATTSNYLFHDLWVSNLDWAPLGDSSALGAGALSLYPWSAAGLAEAGCLGWPLAVTVNFSRRFPIL